MDRQAVEAQEMNAKYSAQISDLKSEYASSSKQAEEMYESKLNELETRCKKQEQELTRMSHQDRVSAEVWYSEWYIFSSFITFRASNL